MTAAACTTCGRVSPVLLRHSLPIGKRLVRWRECRECDARDNARDAETLAERALGKRRTA